MQRISMPLIPDLICVRIVGNKIEQSDIALTDGGRNPVICIVALYFEERKLLTS